MTLFYAQAPCFPFLVRLECCCVAVLTGLLKVHARPTAVACCISVRRVSLLGVARIKPSWTCWCGIGVWAWRKRGACLLASPVVILALLGWRHIVRGSLLCKI